MIVKVAEVEGVRCSDDATARMRDWLKEYATANGLVAEDLIIPSVVLRKESDGWYATIKHPPRQKRRRAIRKTTNMSGVPHVGNRQHVWMYGGPDCWTRQPFRFHTSTGKPPPVLQNLIKKGWMWAHRLPTQRWMPRVEMWREEPTPQYLCGLTEEGLDIIVARRGEIYSSPLPQSCAHCSFRAHWHCSACTLLLCSHHSRDKTCWATAADNAPDHHQLIELVEKADATTIA